MVQEGINEDGVDTLGPHVVTEWGLPFPDKKAKKEPKVRAETYRPERYLKMECYNRQLKRKLNDFFFEVNDSPSNETNNIRLLVGDKGTGKTFAILKIIYEAVIRLELDFNPLIYAFHENQKIERVLGQDLPDDDKEAIEKADIVVFDDIHYIAEAAERNEYDPDDFIDLLDDIVTVASSDPEKKMLLVSNRYLNDFAEIFNSTRYNELIGKLGQTVHDDEFRDVNHMNLMYFNQQFSTAFYESLLDDFDMSAEESVIELMAKNNAPARTVARLNHTFGEKIARDDLVEVVTERIKELNLNHLAYYHIYWVKDMPYVSFNLASLSDEIWKYSNEPEKFIRRKELLDEMIRQISHMIRVKDASINEDDPENIKEDVKFLQDLRKGSALDRRVFNEKYEDYVSKRGLSIDKEEFEKYMDNREDFHKFYKFVYELNEDHRFSTEEITEMLDDYEKMVTNIGRAMIPREIFEVCLSKELYGVLIPRVYALEKIKHLNNRYRRRPPEICEDCSYVEDPYHCTWVTTILPQYFNTCAKEYDEKKKLRQIENDLNEDVPRVSQRSKVPKETIEEWVKLYNMGYSREDISEYFEQTPKVIYSYIRNHPKSNFPYNCPMCGKGYKKGRAYHEHVDSCDGDEHD